jgi:hypothetical protein
MQRLASATSLWRSNIRDALSPTFSLCERTFLKMVISRAHHFGSKLCSNNARNSLRLIEFLSQSSAWF